MEQLVRMLLSNPRISIYDVLMLEFALQKHDGAERSANDPHDKGGVPTANGAVPKANDPTWDADVSTGGTALVRRPGGVKSARNPDGVPLAPALGARSAFVHFASAGPRGKWRRAIRRLAMGAKEGTALCGIGPVHSSPRMHVWRAAAADKSQARPQSS